MRKKILIVEDDPVTRNLYRQIILDDFEDLTVVMGIDGEDGWREFQESQPDLVITDFNMETSDAGFKLARKIKKISPSTPLIMITASNVTEDEGVVDAFLEKPVDLIVFVKTIKKFLRRGGKNERKN